MERVAKDVQIMQCFGGALKMKTALKTRDQNVNIHLEGIEGGRGVDSSGSR
jgi:hypothetical protein